jgi:hypothetical protein
VIDTVPAAVGDVPVALLALTDGSAFVAMRSGAILVRAKEGSWTVTSVDDAAPAPGTHTADPPAELPRP